MEKYQFNKPIFIVGAGRSGTTILKQTLAQHTDFFATEFELNYLWRAGNADLTHDQIDPAQHHTDRGRAYIRKTLHEMLLQSGRKRLVEKTVANVMRVPYLYHVFPEARIIHIIRDGRDVTASAMKRWKSNSGGGYLAKKAMTIPPFDVPRYALRYGVSKIKRILGRKGHDASWGPRWQGMEKDSQNMPLASICARQWVNSVNSVLEVKESFPKAQYLEIRYEDFLNNTGETLDEISSFLEFDAPPMDIWTYAKNTIRAQNETWQTSLSSEDLKLVLNESSDLLKKLGYSL